MSLRQLLDIANPHSLRAYQTRFDKLKADFEKYSGNSRRDKIVLDLRALLKQVSDLGPMGESLEEEIRAFLDTQAVVEQEDQAGPDLERVIVCREAGRLDVQSTMINERGNTEGPGNDRWTGGEF